MRRVYVRRHQATKAVGGPDRQAAGLVNRARKLANQALALTKKALSAYKKGEQASDYLVKPSLTTAIDRLDDAAGILRGAAEEILDPS